MITITLTPILCLLALGPVASGWLQIAGIGGCLFGALVFLFIIVPTIRYRRKRVAEYEASQAEKRERDFLQQMARDQARQSVAQATAQSLGAMSEAQRETALLLLLNAWRHGDHPVTEAAAAIRCRFSRQQVAAFMHWARGQVREDEGGTRWFCKVEPGLETRWLRFVPAVPAALQSRRAAGPESGESIPAGEGPRA